MSLTLARLLADAESFEMRQLAGSGGMNALVRWIHMVEDTEVPGFLHGNELVFTTGIVEHGDAYILASGEADLACRITHIRKSALSP